MTCYFLKDYTVDMWRS